MRRNNAKPVPAVPAVPAIPAVSTGLELALLALALLALAAPLPVNAATGSTHDGGNHSIYNDYVSINITKAEGWEWTWVQVYDQRNPNQKLLTDSSGYGQRAIAFLEKKSSGGVVYPNNVEWLGGDSYKFTYSGSSAHVIIEIKPESNHFVFKLVETANLPPDTNRIYLFKFYPTFNAHLTRRLFDLILDSDVVFDSLQLTRYSVVARGREFYVCAADVDLNSNDVSCAFSTSFKSGYLDAFESIVDEHNLPKLVLSDGKWIRKSGSLRESYFFARLTYDNKDSLLTYVKRGNFKQLLLLQPVFIPFYNLTRFNGFPSNQSFYDAVQTFKDAGIKIGIHTFLNVIDVDDAVALKEWPLKQIIYNVHVGELYGEMNDTATEFLLKENLDGNANYSFYDTNIFLIDNELIYCPNHNGKQVSDCKRGYKRTLPTAHAAGSEASVPPHSTMSADYYFLSPNSELKKRSVDGLADLQTKTGFNFIYADGIPFVGTPELNDLERHNLIDVEGLAPYVNALGKLPLMQYAETNGGFTGKYLSIREASDDGAVFKLKHYTEEHKVKLLADPSPFNLRRELGWWKIPSANFAGGIYDFDSAAYDDIHYAMTKAVAFDSSMGFQAGADTTVSGRTLKLLDVFALYNKLVYEDAERGIVPGAVKEYLDGAAKEAELNNASGSWNFVEKNVTKQYCAWNDASGYEFNFYNKFGNQSLKLQIRPRFDYYGFDYSGNALIKDFSAPPLITPTSNSQEVACVLSSGGALTIKAGSSIDLAACSITIANDDGFDLKYKRGFGLKLEGDGNNEIVVVSAAEGSYGFNRDYKFNVDFTGEKTMVLGDPTNDEKDAPVDWGTHNSKYRSWQYNFSDTRKVVIYVKIVNPEGGKEYSLQFKQLKALQEKGVSSLVNPKIIVSNSEGVQEIVFPVTLKNLRLKA